MGVELCRTCGGTTAYFPLLRLGFFGLSSDMVCVGDVSLGPSVVGQAVVNPVSKAQ
jgi:hypothetical protein